LPIENSRRAPASLRLGTLGPRSLEARSTGNHWRPARAERLDAEDLHAVVDACFRRELCDVKCPHTEADAHPWRLRERANRARRDGVSLRDLALGEPRLLGALTAGPEAKIANLVDANRPLRTPAEARAGIRARFPLPGVRDADVDRLVTRARQASTASTARTRNAPIAEVAFFSTCDGNADATGPSLAAVRVLEHHDLRVQVARAAEGEPERPRAPPAGAAQRARADLGRRAVREAHDGGTTQAHRRRAERHEEHVSLELGGSLTCTPSDRRGDGVGLARGHARLLTRDASRCGDAPLAERD
jgi:hypothetical protein